MPTARFYWVQKALLSHYWRHPWQTFFLLVGLIAGVGLWSAVQIINYHAESSYAEANSLLGAQTSFWVRSRADLGVSEKVYITLRRVGFRQVFPVVEAEVSTGNGEPISIIATDFFALPHSSPDKYDLDIGADSASAWLDFVRPPYQAWVPFQLARELNLQQGDSLLLRDGRRLPPALIQSRSQQGRQVLMDISAAFALLSRNRFSYLAVGKITLLELEQLKTHLTDDLELVENQQHLDLVQLTESLHTHLTAMSLLSFAVGLFIVFNAVRFSLWYRRETLLNLRLMGVGMPSLVVAVLLETLLWSFIGAASGLFVGMKLGRFLLPGLSASLHSLYDATLGSSIELQFSTMMNAWLITLIGLIWALAWPLYQQLRNEVLSASSSEMVLVAETNARRNLTLAALGLLIGAALMYPWLDSANKGFVILAMLLFAAAWLLPLVLVGGLQLISRLSSRQSLLGRWLVSDGWSQLPALRTAMMALLLAMTANLGVGTLVDSFRGAFIDWLEVRQSADIYLRGSHIDYDLLLESDNRQDWLVDSHQRIGVSTRWRNRPTLIRGADTRAPDSLNFPLAQWLGDSPADALKMWRNEANTVLANEQVHYLAGIQPGETIRLVTDSEPRDYRVVGFFYDYGNPYFQFYLPYEEVRQQWKQAYSRGIALWLQPDASVPGKSMKMAEEALIRAGARAGDWIFQSEVKKLSVNIFNRTFAVTSAMNALTLIVAVIALLASLLAILQERLPEFALWRALGVRQSEQFLVMACPLMIFVGIAWLLAIPLGALLSWILIHKLNIVSFGWSMPMRWEMAPAWSLGLLILTVVGFSLIVVMIQLRRQLAGTLSRLGTTL